MFPSNPYYKNDYSLYRNVPTAHMSQVSTQQVTAPQVPYSQQVLSSLIYSPQVTTQQVPYMPQVPTQHVPPMPQAQLATPPTRYNSAYAILKAGPDYPSVRGLVTFVQMQGGVMICADVAGLPPYSPGNADMQPVGPFGFHIHEKGHCKVGDPAKPFEACGGHWNPRNQPHGNHAGDFPVLVADNGRAKMCFIMSRFTLDEIVGRSVMIHENPDDYRSQPAGNAGKRIACGEIKPWSG